METARPLIADSAAAVNRAVLLAVIAHLIWGFAALYWVVLQPLSAWDILAHRMFWSAPTLAVALLCMGRLRRAWAIFRQPALFRLLCASALAQAVNWGLFVWAVTHGQATEAGLGYFLLPLLNMIIGVLAFKEILTRPQLLAFAFAGVGLIVLIAENRGVPWVALGVAVSFGLYGILRKNIDIGAVEGLFAETMLLAPLAAVWLYFHGGAGFSAHGMLIDAFLVGAGLFTVVPLFCFVQAARALPLSIMGLLFYVGPSGQLFVAVFIFDEPMNAFEFAGYCLIWSGLLLVISDNLRRLRRLKRLRRKRRKRHPQPAA